MDAMLLSIPKAPKVPHDFAALLTYQHPQNRVQARRVAESAARHAGIDLDGSTQADDLG